MPHIFLIINSHIYKTIKQKMSFSLSNNPIAQKIRQSMYLRHLREVEKINNREPDSIKKSIHNYDNINDLHHRNKVVSKNRNNLEIKKSIDQMNDKILRKIESLQSDQHISQHIKKSKNELNQTPKSQISEQFKSNVHSATDNIRKLRKSLHFRYRQKEQDRISTQNLKLKKAIEQQKSLIFPHLQKRNKNQRIRSSAKTTDQSQTLNQEQ